MIYILDTNIISYIIRNRDFSLLDKFEKVSLNSQVAVSTITVAELFYGVEKKGSVKLKTLVSEFLMPLEKVAFDTNSALEYGKIRADLEKSGNIIGANDLLIASVTKSKGATLITNNEREFERIDGLVVENWVER